MAHPAQQEFCSEVKSRFQEFFQGMRVLEIGARDVNGSVRDEFSACEYVGVDCEAGEGCGCGLLGAQLRGPAGIVRCGLCVGDIRA